MSLLRDGTVVVVSRCIIAPPSRHGDCRSSRAKDSKRKNEQACETCAIEGTSDEIRVVLEDTRSIVAEVELRVEPDNNPAKQDTRLRLVIRNVARILDELREVDLVDGEFANFGNELQ